MAVADTTSTRTPNPILSLLGRGLESGLNHALGLDPDTRGELAGLDGRAVEISLRGPGLALRVAVEGQSLRVGPAFAGPSALRVTATPGALLGMALARIGGREETGLNPGQVEIAGDAELARRLERLASRFQPDVDEAFARAFGDVLGYQIARAVRHAFAGVRHSASSLVRDSAEYLVEESRDLVARAEMEGFLDDVDALRERADRLGARFERLAAARRP